MENINVRLIKPLIKMRKGHSNTYRAQEDDSDSKVGHGVTTSPGQIAHCGKNDQSPAGCKKEIKEEGAATKKSNCMSSTDRDACNRLQPPGGGLGSTNSKRGNNMQLVSVDREAGDNQILVPDNNNRTNGKKVESWHTHGEDKFKLSAARGLVFLKDISRKIDGNIYPGQMKNGGQKLRQGKNDNWKSSEQVPDTLSVNECAHETQNINSMHRGELGVDSYIGVNYQTVVGGENFGTQYTKPYVHIPRRYPDRYYTQSYDFPDESEPLLLEPSLRFQIYPISSCTKTLNNFRRTDMGEKYYQKGQSLTSISHKDLLDELRSVAKHEARNLGDLYNKTEEIYFQPPVSPSKHPLQYLKDVVGSAHAEQYLAEPKTKITRAKREICAEVDSDADQSSFKSFNDFDEDIFKFDLNNKMYTCPWDGCDKTFPSLSRIKRHYIIHTDIKPFKCQNPGCDRRFSRKDNMLQHYRVHCPFANQTAKTQ